MSNGFAARAGKIFKHEYLRVISIGCIILFSILPLITLAFHVTGTDWEFILKDNRFWEAVKNSLIYTSASAVITTILALITSYLLNSSNLKRKPRKCREVSFM